MLAGGRSQVHSTPNVATPEPPGFVKEEVVASSPEPVPTDLTREPELGAATAEPSMAGPVLAPGMWLASMPIGAKQRCWELLLPSPHETNELDQLNKIVPAAAAPGLRHSVHVDGVPQTVELKPVPTPDAHPGVLVFPTDVEFGGVIRISYHRVRDQS